MSQTALVQFIRRSLLCACLLPLGAAALAEAPASALTPSTESAAAQPPAPPSGPARPTLPARRPAAPEIAPPGIEPSGGPGGRQGAGDDKGGTEPVADAPVPREIVARHIKAIGGEEAIRKQTSVSKKIDISIEGMPQASSRLEVKSKAPNRYLATMASPMGEIRQGFDGTVGWMIVPGQGATLLSGKQLAQMKVEADMFRDLNLFKIFPSAETVGQRDFGGGRCWHVRFSGGENDATSYFYDVESGILRGYETVVSGPMGETPAAMIIVEWKEVDGVKHPARMTQEVMGMKQVVAVESIDLAPLADDVFALPMPVQAILDRQKESSDPSKAPPVPGR